MAAQITHLGVTRLIGQMRDLSADPVLTRVQKLQINAAICCLAGDLAGVEQNLAAARIPQADWEAAARGELDY